MSSTETTPIFRDSQAAFEDAIEAGRLAASPNGENYAGDFMYMGTWRGIDSFKNRNTRRYLPDPVPAKAKTGDQQPCSFSSKNRSH